MDIDFWIRFLLWSLAANYVILLVWFAAIVFAHGWVRKLHGRWFHMSDNTFDAIHYGGMALYKVLVLTFNLAPLLALWLVR